MGLNFLNKVIRDSAILTTSYVASTIISDAANYNELALYCYYTKGSLTSLEILIESSIDGVNYVPETNMSVSAGTVTLNEAAFTTTEDGNLKITIPMSAHFIRISAKGTGTVTNSLLGLESFLHTV